MCSTQTSFLHSKCESETRGWEREWEPGEDRIGRQVRRGRVLLCAKSNTHQNMIHKIDSPSRESLPVTSSARQNRRDYSWLSRRAACSLQGRNRVLTQAPALPRAGSSSTRSTEPVRWGLLQRLVPTCSRSRAAVAGGSTKVRLSLPRQEPG